MSKNAIHGIFLSISILFSMNGATQAEPTGEWERSLTLGFNQARGNSDTLLHRVAGRAELIEERYEWLYELEWTYGEADKDKNAEFGRMGVEYKRLIDTRFFADAMAEISYDAIKKLDYRVIYGPALGYFFLRDEQFRLSVEGGPSHVVQRQDRLTQDFVALRLAQDFSWRINKRARLWQGTEYIPRIDDFNRYLLNSEIGVESAVSAAISLGVTLQHRYDSHPAEDTKRNDLNLVSTLKYTF